MAQAAAPVELKYLKHALPPAYTKLPECGLIIHYVGQDVTHAFWLVQVESPDDSEVKKKMGSGIATPLEDATNRTSLSGFGKVLMADAGFKVYCATNGIK